MKKEKKKKTKKPVFIKMPPIANFIYATVSMLHVFFHYHAHIDRRALKEQKRGCILIYNHSSNIDYYFVKAALGYRRANLVLARYFFFNKKLAFVLNWAHAISKEQLKPDVTAIRKMKKVVDAGGVVMIAPAGQIVVDGTLPYIPKSIVKLVRLTNADVLSTQMRGIYLNYPKWRKSERKCKNISLITKKTLVREDLLNMTDDEIYNKLVESISIDENRLQEDAKWEIKGKSLTSGLEHLLVRCPKCGALHSFDTNNNELKCAECAYTVRMNKYGNLENVSEEDKNIGFRFISDWYKWQEEEIGKDYQKEDFELVMEGELQTNILEENKLQNSGCGKLTFKDGKIIYEGTVYEEYLRKEFNMKVITQLPFDCGVRVDIPDMDYTYRFIPKNKKLIIDFVQVINYINKKNNE